MLAIAAVILLALLTARAVVFLGNPLELDQSGPGARRAMRRRAPTSPAVVAALPVPAAMPLACSARRARIVFDPHRHLRQREAGRIGWKQTSKARKLPVLHDRRSDGARRRSPSRAAWAAMRRATKPRRSARRLGQMNDGHGDSRRHGTHCQASLPVAGLSVARLVQLLQRLIDRLDLPLLVDLRANVLARIQSAASSSCSLR